MGNRHLQSQAKSTATFTPAARSVRRTPRVRFSPEQAQYVEQVVEDRLARVRRSHRADMARLEAQVDQLRAVLAGTRWARFWRWLGL